MNNKASEEEGAQKKPKNKVGRPSIFTPELSKYVCDIVASNPYGIRKLCKMYSGMPDEATINIWRRVHPQFFADYVIARKQQAHLLFENALDELEEINDYVYENPVTGAKEVNAGIVAMKKVIANQKSRQAAILHKNYMLKDDNEEVNKSDSFDKVRELVNSFNEKNKSDV